MARGWPHFSGVLRCEATNWRGFTSGFRVRGKGVQCGVTFLGCRVVLRANGSGKQGVFRGCNAPPSAVLMWCAYLPTKTREFAVKGYRYDAGTNRYLMYRRGSDTGADWGISRRKPWFCISVHRYTALLASVGDWSIVRGPLQGSTNDHSADKASKEARRPGRGFVTGCAPALKSRKV
jgi:hypothetical protein